MKMLKPPFPLPPSLFPLPPLSLPLHPPPPLPSPPPLPPPPLHTQANQLPALGTDQSARPPRMATTHDDYAPATGDHAQALLPTRFSTRLDAFSSTERTLTETGSSAAFTHYSATWYEGRLWLDRPKMLVGNTSLFNGTAELLARQLCARGIGFAVCVVIHMLIEAAREKNPKMQPI